MNFPASSLAIWMRLRKHAENQSDVSMSTSAIMEDVKLLCQVCTEFWSNSSDCMATLGANMTEYTSQMELFVILALL